MRTSAMPPVGERPREGRREPKEERTVKRLAVVLAVLVVAGWSASAWASDTKGKPEAKVTLKGEVLDMGCFMDHGAKGEKHKSCALKCVAGGMPMGLLTADGKVYLITMDHDDADPYNKCKELAGSTVQITGAVSQRAGMKSINCSDVKAM
jgi:hypothetical protein